MIRSRRTWFERIERREMAATFARFRLAACLVFKVCGPWHAGLFLGRAPLDEKFAEEIFDLLI